MRGVPDALGPPPPFSPLFQAPWLQRKAAGATTGEARRAASPPPGHYPMGGGTERALSNSPTSAFSITASSPIGLGNVNGGAQPAGARCVLEMGNYWNKDECQIQVAQRHFFCTVIVFLMAFPSSMSSPAPAESTWPVRPGGLKGPLRALTEARCEQAPSTPSRPRLQAAISLAIRRRRSPRRRRLGSSPPRSAALNASP